MIRRWDSDPFLGSCSLLTPCPGGETTPFGTSLVNFIEADGPVVSLRLGEQDAAPGYLTRYRTTSPDRG